MPPVRTVDTFSRTLSQDLKNLAEEYLSARRLASFGVGPPREAKLALVKEIPEEEKLRWEGPKRTLGGREAEFSAYPAIARGSIVRPPDSGRSYHTLKIVTH